MDIIGALKVLGQQLQETSWIEYVGVAFGVVQVLLAKSNKVWLYPFGIASVLITIYVLSTVGLYAEVLLNLYYLVMSFYGWYLWVNKKEIAAVSVGYSSRAEWITSLMIVALGFLILYWVLVEFTDSNVPVMDAWVTATAWAGMWLLAKRKIENWIFLNVSNLFAIPLFAYKGLMLYSLLTLFLFIVAIFGYFEWRRIIRGNEKINA